MATLSELRICITNREAVQRLQEVQDLLSEYLYDDRLRRASECIDEVFDGLEFAVPKKDIDDAKD